MASKYCPPPPFSMREWVRQVMVAKYRTNHIDMEVQNVMAAIY